jgi:DNA (cytosine-5)-methyltransferase 1
MNKKKFTFVDLFSGVGGFRIPLEKLGGTCVAYSEIDKNAIEVYKNNFKTSDENFLDDITSVKTVPKSDLIVGGVPCQAWSVAGKKKGFDDPRGKLWEDTIRVVKKSKPKTFIFENVKGLYDPRNKASLNLIISEFRKCNYEVYHKVLNAFDFGLPQNRDRLFIIGIRKDIKSDFNFPLPTRNTKTLSKIIDGLDINPNHLNKKKFIPTNLFGEKIPFSRNRFQKDDELNDFFIFCDTRDGHTTIHSWDLIKTTQLEKKICLAILKNRRKKIYGEWDGNPLSFKSIKELVKETTIKNIDSLMKKNILTQEEDGRYELMNTKNSAGINGVYRVFLPQSDIFSTITATENRDFIATKSISGKNPEDYKAKFINEIFLKKNFRLLTGRESARLQGFPDSFKIHSNDKIAKKQFGNAVPTNVVYHLAKEIVGLKSLNL